MNVKKEVLESKTDKELEKYLIEGNQFVHEANKLAFEILKSRGRTFTDEETEKITLMITEKSKKEQIVIHENYKKSANVFYIAAALGIINMFISPELLNSNRNIFTSIFTLAFLFGIGLLISKGIDWMKYVLLALLIFGLFALPLILLNIINSPILGIINIIQTVLQVYSLVLLFKIPKVKTTFDNIDYR